MKKRDRKEYEGRYNDQPEEIRILLRARSLQGDSNMEVYRREIAQARTQPDPKLLAQIAALLGRESKKRIPAMMLLEDLFTKTFMLPEPPFLKDPPEKKKALESLISSLSAAKDRWAVETLVLTFLKASGVGKIDLDVAHGQVRLRLEARADGAKVCASSGPADDVDWLKVLPTVVPACRKWMAEQLPK